MPVTCTVRNHTLQQCKHLLSPKFQTFLSKFIFPTVSLSVSLFSEAHRSRSKLSPKSKLSATGTTYSRRLWGEKNVSSRTVQFVRYLSSGETSTIPERGHASVESVCRRWAERLEKSNIPEARTSVEYIVAHVLGRKTVSTMACAIHVLKRVLVLKVNL